VICRPYGLPSGVPDRLPLFPLGLVLFPGLVLPLHVFEERYRALVRHLLELPEDQRRFGVVAVRRGREVGAGAVLDLHDVGCSARLLRVEPYDDGRYDVVTTGAERFRLRGVSQDQPYLTGDVDWLPDEPGDPADAALQRAAVAVAFPEYLEALAEAGAAAVPRPELPASSVVLSHLVAATLLLDVEERQALLEEPDAASRLRAERRLLRRELALLGALSAVPSPDLVRVPPSPN
jgi:uncharacterized protein